MLTRVRAMACAGCVGWTAPERTLLAALPDAAQAVPERAWCELESGHDGPHHGLGQISGPAWWWLRWSEDGRHREFVEAGFCGVRPARGNGDCSLPRNHVGAHSFLLATAD